MLSPLAESCGRGHADSLRYVRPNGRRSNCLACAKLSRLFPSGTIPESPADWPELLRPGNETLLLRWLAMPANHRWMLGGVERVTAAQVERWLAGRR